MISYIGGKYRMAKWISAYVPKNIVLYGEIFGGAFWTYLKSDIIDRPNLKGNIYYNDFNKLMVNMFACSKDTQKFQERFNHIESQDNDKFNKFRDEVFEIMSDEEKLKKVSIPNYELGYKYPYLLTQVFSGVGIKQNTKMQDLKGKYKSKFEAFRKRLTDTTSKDQYKRKLENIKDTLNLDFEEAVKKLDKEDAFLYFDPPYYDTETYYSFHEFGREDHKRLRNSLYSMKGMFALSYYDFEGLSDWFPKYDSETGEGFHWEEKEFRKAASAKKGVKQNKGKEVLIMNYIPNFDSDGNPIVGDCKQIDNSKLIEKLKKID